MKVACLQFAPELGKVEENMRRADAILSQTVLPARLDWLILPEMAFSGYNFHSLSEITPYLEPTTSGPTTQWAIRTALQHNCHVTVGYPETSSTPGKASTHYNSTVTVTPSGTVLLNYRKSFLYYTDETWAAEGTGFYAGNLGSLGKVSLGICMDINPYRFITPWDAYEFASKALEAQTPVICVSMAWLTTLSPEELAQEPLQADFTTLTYWVERFQPLVEKKALEPVYVILANRCGMEKAACYAGTTTVLKIEEGRVSVYDVLGKGEERCLVVDLNQTPKFRVRSD
ncbi:N-terminal asparagine amidohydrolase-like protein [Westerdykella ornata]|uniref:N-terminal asparagine amidohydrolase-like protein n=1 Tax=Westerdykella ornata TaxID=318751 RepID=A0A6A6JAX3_WESOR|nr:N-terminal asparagine amidohydrolase-like protein [Westerdykella ornata]KAF2272776.1 N-terminal asparagine amidohydrolase-like protein [Westerdykella ornata]